MIRRASRVPASSPPRRSQRPKTRLQPTIPVLVGLAVDGTATYQTNSWCRTSRDLSDPSHEAWRDQDHMIAFGHHAPRPSANLSGDGFGLNLQHLREELHDRGPSRRRIGVVLDVSLGKPFVREFPMPGFEQVADDVVGGLLVGVQLRIGAREQRLCIRRSRDRFLGSRLADYDEQGNGTLNDRPHHVTSARWGSAQESRPGCTRSMTRYPTLSEVPYLGGTGLVFAIQNRTICRPSPRRPRPDDGTPRLA